MTAPVSLREYFAAVGSPFSKADADVIGPQLETMAEDGALPTDDDAAAQRVIVDTARSDNSPLHGFFIWDDARAADMQRLDHAGKMLRSIRVRVMKDDRPSVMPAYRIARAQPKPPNKGFNVLHGESASAVQKAREAFDELKAWRARYSAYITVWQEFADAFQGVANQIGEAAAIVEPSLLDDTTDQALTDMAKLVGQCSAWQTRHASAVGQWPAIAEQAGYIVEAIDAATQSFADKQISRQRPCLKCSAIFESSGAGNRLCKRCAERR